jgi:beta-glucosidase
MALLSLARAPRTGRRLLALLLIAALGGLLAVRAPAQPASSSRAVELAGELDRRAVFVDSLLSMMTLEEKLGQLAQTPSRWSDTGPTVPSGGKSAIREGRVGSFLSLYGAETTRKMQRIAVEESRLGIPLLFAYDVVHGYRTIFPIPLAETSSFHPDLARRTARASAMEATAGGVHWTFSPMVDVTRDPRWGRIMEGAGEDPYLNSVFAASRVQGYQTPDPSQNLSADTTLLSTAKHFVAYGAAQAGRDYNPADISEHTLHEIFLPPFHAALEAGAGSVMPGFNDIGGVPMHANGRLIDGLLRDAWNWDGLVVSDYTAVMELMPHGIARDSVDAGVQALEAGVDVDMVSGIYVNTLAPAVRSGRLHEQEVNEAVRRILRAKWDLGLFHDPYRYGSPEAEEKIILSEENRDLAREAATESMVLLKNEGDLLPLSKDAGTVAVIGPLANDARTILGEWAGSGRAEDAVSLLDGIREALDGRSNVRHAAGLPSSTSSDTTGLAEAVKTAQAADAVVLVLGEPYDYSGEAASRTSLRLPGRQQALADSILATSTPTATVLLNGRPLAIPHLAEEAPAILEAWYPGTEAGPAVADLVFGDAVPSGKLPVSIPRNVGQVPIYYNHVSTGRPPKAETDYTSRYLNTPWTALFPFGHGLSYTTFAYDNPRVSTDSLVVGDTLTVKVDLTNTGDRTGTEVAQLYVEDPVATITRPVRELRDFARVELRPGATKTISFRVTMDDLAYMNRDTERVVEPGHFHLHVGASSADTKTVSFRLVGSTTHLPRPTVDERADR